MRDQADPLRETPAGAVHASPTALSLTRVLIICLAAGVFLGLIGPLGSDAMPLGLRLGYWMVAAVGGGVLGWVVSNLVMLWPLARRHTWLMIVAVATLMTPPGMLLIWTWSRAVLPGASSHLDLFPLAWSVFVISLVMTAINALIAPPAPAQAAAAPVAPPAPEPARTAFLDRLPPRLRGAELLAVEAEDHYLRVHTAKGSDLILLRLSDALNELAGLDGARTHRSWWVARAAVRDAAKGDGRATLTLEGGLKAPVSRAHAPGLRAAGWV